MEAFYENSRSPASTATEQDVLSSYASQLQQVQARLTKVQAQRLWALIGAIGCVFALAGLGYTSFVSGHPWFVAAVLPGIFFGIAYRQSGEEWKRLAAREKSLEHGIARLSDSWQEGEETGLEFARPEHLYQEDLQVLGTGSLFMLLATTRSRIGAARLATYLLDPADSMEVRLRQESVKELVQAAGIREQMQLIGSYQVQDGTADDFAAWFSTPLFRVPSVFPLTLLSTGIASLVIVIGIWIGALTWYPAVFPIAGLLLLQACIVAMYFTRIRPHPHQLGQLTGSFTVLQQGLQLMEDLEFHSTKLGSMVERLRKDHAAANVRTLEKLVHTLDQREKSEFYLLSRLCAMGTQLVFAVNRWRSMHQSDLKEWLDIWAEFEVLQALALYAFEHPQNVFPQLVEEPLMLKANQLKHPLLPAATCIGNDVQLDPNTRFYLVTGSNMAGKSTLLRAVGLNTVLAQTGAPVCAEFAYFSNMRVCAAFSPRESLGEGRSRFLAEVARLRGAFTQSGGVTPMLFLIDEILSGTNSRDRLLATEIILKAFLYKGAIGMISTHDLALTSLANNAEARGVLVHMESANSEDPLAFDYLLKSGVSHNASALAIVRMMGLDAVAR